MIRKILQKDALVRLRTIVRFEAQNSNWGLAEWEKFSNAWAYGLRELNFGPKSKVLTWLDENHTAELATVLLGSAKIGAQITSADSLMNSNKKEKSLERVLEEVKPDVFVFSPHQSIDNLKKEDIVKASLGNFRPKLVVHTGFYSKPSWQKFKDIMVFRDRRFSSLEELDYDQFLIDISKEDLVKTDQNDKIIFTGPFSDHNLMLKALVSSAMPEGVFTNFVPSKKFLSEAAYIADSIGEESKVHVIAEKGHEKQFEASMKRKNNQFHYY